MDVCGGRSPLSEGAEPSGRLEPNGPLPGWYQSERPASSPLAQQGLPPWRSAATMGATPPASGDKGTYRKEGMVCRSEQATW